MKSSGSSINFLKPLASFLRRFHTIIFFLIVSSGLFVAILMVISIIGISSTTAGTSDQTISSSFDEATIKQLQDTSIPSRPPGRVSPFIE